MSKDVNQDGPLIEPMERDSYPDGIPEALRDRVLKDETELLEGSYIVSPFEKQPYNLRVKLSISFKDPEEIVIDFNNYPEKPWIILDDKLQFELGKNLTDLSYFLKNWDTRRPPHVIEIVKELEALLMRSRLSGKLGHKTDEIKPPEPPRFDPKAVLIVDKATRMLIFIQKLTVKAPVDKKELSQVIKTINAEIDSFEVNSFNKIRMPNEMIYFFINFDRLIVIMLCKGEAPPPSELLHKINDAFIDRFADFLEDYSKSDVIAFKPFSQNINQYLETYLYEEPEKDLEIQITELLEEKEPPKPILKPIKPPEPKVKPSMPKGISLESKIAPPITKVSPELIKTVEFKPYVKTKAKSEPKIKDILPASDNVPDIFKPPSLRTKQEPVKFQPIIREETPPEEIKPIKKIDLKPIIFNAEANDLSKANGYCLNFTDYSEFYNIAMEAWGAPETDPEGLLKIEKDIHKKMKSSSIVRALFISSNPLDPTVFKLWLKIGKIKKSEIRKSLTMEYLCFIESKVNGKETFLCWAGENNELTILREINDDPLHLQILFETTDRVKEWNFK